MKKLVTIFVMSFSILMMQQVANAAPHFDQDHKAEHNAHPKKGPRHFDRANEDDIQERRKAREERGVKRLQQFKWQTGYTMPQHYRSDAYKVNFKNSNLPKPGRNQQWYKVNNDYLLIDSATNNIIQIQNR